MWKTFVWEDIEKCKISLMKITILVPVYNDWQSLSKLIDVINGLSISQEFQISITIVNDASNHDRQNEDKDFKIFAQLKS